MSSFISFCQGATGYFFGEKATSTNRNTVIEGVLAFLDSSWVVLIQGFGCFSGGAQSMISGSVFEFDFFFRETSR